MAGKQTVKNHDLNFAFKTLMGSEEETGATWSQIVLLILRPLRLMFTFQPVQFQVYGSVAERLELKGLLNPNNGDVDLMVFPTVGSLMIHHELIEYLPEHPLHVRIKGADHPMLQSCLVEGTDYVATSALKNFHPALFSRSVGHVLPFLLKVKHILNSWQLENSANSPATTINIGPALPFGVDSGPCFSLITEMLRLKYMREWDCLQFAKGRSLRTPVKMMDSQLLEERQGEIISVGNVDLVPALRSLEWPKVAREWIRRERKWPSPQVVNKVVQKGFHLVVKSPKIGGNRKCDFRISFSHAEYLLSQEMNDIQRDCYLCLKKLHRAYLSKEPKGLVTFHLKNIFLKTIEETGADFWTVNNRAECVMMMLGNLLEALREKNLPHYFVKSYNLFCVDYIDKPVILEPIAEKVAQIINNPMKFVRKLIQNHRPEGTTENKNVSTTSTQNGNMDDISLD